MCAFGLQACPLRVPDFPWRLSRRPPAVVGSLAAAFLAMSFDVGSAVMWMAIAAIVGGLAFCLVCCRESKTASYLASPLTVQACIFSLDDGTQSWAKVLTLLGEVRKRQTRGTHRRTRTHARRRSSVRNLCFREFNSFPFSAVVSPQTRK